MATTWFLTGLLLVAYVVLLLSAGAEAWNKCAACQAVAAELEIGLLNEKPRFNLDMRHRLNSKGQREGKVIDYKASDLRVVELLDGLCSRMKEYTLVTVGPEKERWTKTAKLDSDEDRQKADFFSKQMSTYCGRLLDETEEELEQSIKQGSLSVGNVESILCQDLARQCDPSRATSDGGEL